MSTNKQHRMSNVLVYTNTELYVRDFSLCLLSFSHHSAFGRFRSLRNVIACSHQITFSTTVLTMVIQSQIRTALYVRVSVLGHAAARQRPTYLSHTCVFLRTRMHAITTTDIFTYVTIARERQILFQLNMHFGHLIIFQYSKSSFDFIHSR